MKLKFVAEMISVLFVIVWLILLYKLTVLVVGTALMLSYILSDCRKRKRINRVMLGAFIVLGLLPFDVTIHNSSGPPWLVSKCEVQSDQELTLNNKSCFVDSRVYSLLNIKQEVI